MSRGSRLISGGNQHAKKFSSWGPNGSEWGIGILSNPSNPSKPSNQIFCTGFDKYRVVEKGHTQHGQNGTFPGFSTWLTTRENRPKNMCIPTTPLHGVDADGWMRATGRKVVKPSPPKPHVFLPPRLANATPPSKGSVMQLSDGARQLTMEILVCPPDGEQKRVRALIDTGAQLNVVRKGLFSESNLQPAKHPIMLTLADGQAFWGGDIELVANLTFGKIVDGKPQPWKSKAQFYEGLIKADLILGLPWLVQNGLDVLTRDGCLGERKGCRVFLICDCPEIPENSGDDHQKIDTSPSHVIGCGPQKKRMAKRQCTVVKAGILPNPPSADIGKRLGWPETPGNVSAIGAAPWGPTGGPSCPTIATCPTETAGPLSFKPFDPLPLLFNTHLQHSHGPPPPESQTSPGLHLTVV